MPTASRLRITVEVNGFALKQSLFDAVYELRVAQIVCAPTQCEVAAYLHLDTHAPSSIKPGAALSVRIEEAVLFEGDITAVEYSYRSDNRREVRFRAYDRLHRLRKRQTLRAHVDVSAADLARELVSRDGLTVVAANTGPVFARIIQSIENDLDFLTQTAARSGLHVYVRANELRLFSYEGVGPALELMLGSSLLEAHVEANADAVCQSVTAEAWTTNNAQPVRGHADVPRSARSISTSIEASAVHASDERFLVDEIVQDQSHAELLAQSELDARHARAIVITGIAEGDVRLIPGQQINVGGLAPEFCGGYMLTSATHTVSATSGYITRFSTDPLVPRPRPRGAATTTGIVFRVDDPENLGRVCLSLPAYGGVETGWIPVVSPGAGAGKGFVNLPDIDDSVLVLLPRHNPAEAIVLGGLYASNRPLDAGVENGRVRRWLMNTPSGNRLCFDDSRKSVRIESGAGSYLEFTPERATLHASSDLTIEAPGRAITIAAAAIDFEKV
jgi:phage protein D/phage baseplate assembly protein gpV